MIVTDILEKTCKNFPDKNAMSMRIKYRTITLTYRQLYDLVKRIALFLEKQGVNKEDKVLLLGHNSPYWSCIFWANMLHGYITVPINIQSTSEMIQKIANQTEAKIIFKSRLLRQTIPAGLKSYDIEFIDELVQDFDISNFKKADVKEDDLIEILYTSGTTGDPKGVLLTHKNIYSNLEAITEIFSLSKHKKERLLSILPLTHIFEQTIGLFLPCWYAAHIVYAHSYAAILDLMQKYHITKLLAVPEFLKVIMSKIEATAEQKGRLKIFNEMLKFSSRINIKFIARLLFRSIHKKFGGKLDTVASGGAFLNPELEKKWRALGVDLLQGYGLTETSPVVTCNSYAEYKPGSVGKVIKNVQIKIADDGEILVKGPSVFSGYFKNEQKTKECFTPDGWFKTEDIGQLDKDGFLFLKGRKKYIIQGPGAQNVFPEDIEFELNKNPQVIDSCIVGLDLPTGMVEIHAILLLEPDVKDIEKIIDKTNENLASYQHITGYTIWPEEDFPRSATRKIQKEKVLVKLKEKPKEEIVAKKVETKERPLLQILSQTTGVDIAQIKDETKIIRDLKVDSLMWVELVVRIEQDLGISIDETALKPTTTVMQLEEIIRKTKPGKKIPPLKKWPLSWWAHFIRVIGQFVFFVFARIFIRLKVEGKENLKNLPLPVIFMSNHISYLDPLAIIMAIPFKIRKKLAFPAALDVLYKDFKYIAWLTELLANSFQLPRLEGENIAVGLDHMGQLLDKNYSPVFFPEGQVSLDSKQLPLKRGAGLLATDMNAWIVPLKIEGMEKIFPYTKIFPRKIGKVTVKFGKPIKFKKSDSYGFAAKKIEEEMRKL